MTREKILQARKKRLKNQIEGIDYYELAKRWGGVTVRREPSATLLLLMQSLAYFEDKKKPPLDFLCKVHDHLKFFL